MSYFATTNFYLEVAKGRVPGHEIFVAFGRNPAVGGTAELLTDFGGNVALPSVAESLEIVSTSANDTLGGTGANAVSISYLDDLYVRQNVVVFLNGVTAVPIPGTAIRVNLSLVVLSGTGRVNAGDIIIRVAGGGTTRALILAGASVNRQGIYTVPASHTAFVEKTPIITGRNNSANAEIVTFSPLTNTTNSNVALPVTEGTSSLESFPVSIPEKTDYYLRATNAGGGSIAVSGIISVMEVDNAQLP